jgi:hypothetical protein
MGGRKGVKERDGRQRWKIRVEGRKEWNELMEECNDRMEGRCSRRKQ